MLFVDKLGAGVDDRTLARIRIGDAGVAQRMAGQITMLALNLIL
jgi:hypothetical protein